MPRTVATALILALALGACAAPRPEGRRFHVQAGPMDIDVGGVDLGTGGVAIAEYETPVFEEEGASGVVGVLWSQSEVGVDLGSLGTVDVDTRALGAHGGIRWRPTAEDWDYVIVPVFGLGLQYLQLDLDAPGLAGESSGGLGGYLEAGIEWGAFSAKYRYLDAVAVEFGGVSSDASAGALLFGVSMGF